MKFAVCLGVLWTVGSGCGHMAPLYPSSESYPPPKGNFCRVLEDWKSGSIKPRQLCDRYNGAFCSMVKTPGQAICSASDKAFCTDVKTLGEGICKAGEGSSCAGIKTTAAGICAALRGSFCSGETDAVKWNRRLALSCGFSAPRR